MKEEGCEHTMSGYRLYLLHGAMVSRERAEAAWDEADRIEALSLHAGVVDALKKIGWVVDVDDSEADYGQTRWLLWVRDLFDALEIVAGTPLGYLGLLKMKLLEPEDAVSTREWLKRVREERRGDPEPPAAGNILEQLLEKIQRKKVLERLDDPGFGDAEKILVSWAMYRSMDQAIKEGNGGPSVELRDDLRKKLLRTVQDIRLCDGVWPRTASAGPALDHGR